MVLDNADLSYADLSNKNFSGTSFRNAVLQNTNFTDSDFSGCDFSGVRLEETSSVQAVTVAFSGNIYASYEDGVIREWIHQRVDRPYSIHLSFEEKAKQLRIYAFPGSHVSILDDERLFFYDREVNSLALKAVFEIKPSSKLTKVTDDHCLIFQGENDANKLMLLNIRESKIWRSIDVSPNSICDHFGGDAFVVYSHLGGRIIDATPSKRKEIVLDLSDVTCLATCCCRTSPNRFRLAAGCSDGVIHILDVNLGSWEIERQVRCETHEKTVKDIAFIDDERIVSCSFDKKLNLITSNRGDYHQIALQELKIALQCKGMNVDRLTPDGTRNLLERVRDSM